MSACYSLEHSNCLFERFWTESAARGNYFWLALLELLGQQKPVLTCYVEVLHICLAAPHIFSSNWHFLIVRYQWFIINNRSVITASYKQNADNRSETINPGIGRVLKLVIYL